MYDSDLPVRLAKFLGAKALIMGSAVGGLNPGYNVGDITVLADHINLMGANPLIGINDDRLGPRFPDMSRPYDAELISTEETDMLGVGIISICPGPMDKPGRRAARCRPCASRPTRAAGCGQTGKGRGRPRLSIQMDRPENSGRLESLGSKF